MLKRKIEVQDAWTAAPTATPTPAAPTLHAASADMATVDSPALILQQRLTAAYDEVEDRWSPRKAAAFMAVTSLAGWGVIALAAKVVLSL